MKTHLMDLAAAARLAVRHYGRMLDPNKHHIPYFLASFEPEGACAFHIEWDFGDAIGRYLDALILCRHVTGGDEGREAEEHLKDALRWTFSPGDGLSWRMETNEWVQYGVNIFDQRSVLLGLLAWYFDAREDEPLYLIKGLLQGLRRLAVEREDYLCFPFTNYTPGMQIPAQGFDEHGFVVDPAHYGGGVLILPLAIYYEATGDEEALDLLQKLTNFIVRHSQIYSEDGSFWNKGRYPDDGHFHSKAGTLAGLIRYAACIGDRELLEWCDRVYRWARSRGSSSGWFPEEVGLNGQPPARPELPWVHDFGRHSEICGTTDMIHCALALSRSGLRDYWDHAESYMNHLLASQLIDLSWANEISGKPDTDQATWRDVPDRYRGGFTGRNKPNDLTNGGRIDTMACCCAAGGRGVYLLWDSIVERQQGGIRINYFISRDTEDITIESRFPDAGRVELVLKRETAVWVRVPAWLRAEEIDVKVNEQPRACPLEGGCLALGNLQHDDQVTLEFPLSVRRREEVVAGETYEITWIGNRVVGIDPPGPYQPLYQD